MAATKMAPRRAARKTRKTRKTRQTHGSPGARTSTRDRKGPETSIEAPVGELISLVELETAGAAAGEGGPEEFFFLYVPRR